MKFQNYRPWAENTIPIQGFGFTYGIKVIRKFIKLLFGKFATFKITVIKALGYLGILGIRLLRYRSQSHF